MATFLSIFESELENEGFVRPKFIQALDKVVECRQGKQLLVEVKLDMVADVKWFMDGRLLKSCEEFFKDGRLHEGGGDGVHIIEVLPGNFKGLTAYPYRLMVPNVQNDCSLRVTATNEFGESESTAQIHVTPEVPTCRVKVGNEQNQQQPVKARKQLEKQPTFHGSYEVMDAGNAFEPTTTNAQIRRKFVVEVRRKFVVEVRRKFVVEVRRKFVVEVRRKTSTPIQRAVCCNFQQEVNKRLDTLEQFKEQQHTVNAKFEKSDNKLNKKTFDCSICQKKFSHSSNLSKHKRVHTGEKPFKCAICKKRFSRWCARKAHLRVHTGQRPFKKCIKVVIVRQIDH